MKIKPTYLPLFFAGFLACGIWLGSKIERLSNPNLSNTQPTNKKLSKLLQFIENEYVDQVNTDSIIDLSVNEILSHLDPHSVYINASEFTQVHESMKGNFVGIGINFNMKNDTLAVIRTIEGGPSEKAGLKSGDRILLANTDTLYSKKLTTENLYSILKGKKGTKVNLKVYRKYENKFYNITVTRNEVPIKSVDVGLMMQNGIGYIKINRFAETTYQEFKKELIELKKQGLKELIIDLRNNGGGYLEGAISIIDELLEKDKVIVITKNKDGKENKTIATDNGLFEQGKITVLINEHSASASEILAGAIQDNDRGTIVGRRSFGKGLVQREFPLDDGSIIRLTVARYYTPTGRSIQKPYNDNLEEYYNESFKRYHQGELYSLDSIKVADSLKFKTPKGKTVYGGGGIIPDLFVPLENIEQEKIAFLLKTALLDNFAFSEIEKHGKKYHQFSYEEFKKYTLEKDYSQAYAKYLSEVGISFDFLRKPKYKKLINTYIVAEMTRQLFSEKMYYQMILPEDVMINEAIQLNK